MESIPAPRNGHRKATRSPGLASRPRYRERTCRRKMLPLQPRQAGNKQEYFICSLSQPAASLDYPVEVQCAVGSPQKDRGDLYGPQLQSPQWSTEERSPLL